MQKKIKINRKEVDQKDCEESKHRQVHEEIKKKQVHEKSKAN